MRITKQIFDLEARNKHVHISSYGGFFSHGGTRNHPKSDHCSTGDPQSQELAILLGVWVWNQWVLQLPPRKWQYMAASGRKSWLQGKGSKSKLSQFNAKARHVDLNSSLRCHQRISDLPSPMDPETFPLLYPWIHVEHGELGVALQPCQIWIDRPVPMGWSALYQSLLTDHWGVHCGSPTMIWGFCKMGVILNHPFL